MHSFSLKEKSSGILHPNGMYSGTNFHDAFDEAMYLYIFLDTPVLFCSFQIAALKRATKEANITKERNHILKICYINKNLPIIKTIKIRDKIQRKPTKPLKL